MTRRAFDTCANVADQLCRCLETPYSDVLEHHTVPATEKPGQRTSPLAWLCFCMSRPFRGGVGLNPTHRFTLLLMQFGKMILACCRASLASIGRTSTGTLGGGGWYVFCLQFHLLRLAYCLRLEHTPTLSPSMPVVAPGVHPQEVVTSRTAPLRTKRGMATSHPVILTTAPSRIAMGMDSPASGNTSRNGWGGPLARRTN